VGLMGFSFLFGLHLFVKEAAADPLHSEIEGLAKKVEAKVIQWRRDIHEHPELAYQEVRTAKLIADHLKNLGLEVQTGVAKTGVIGILKGSKSTPVVALRADMDALPVKELTGLPYASKAEATYKGSKVPVMHACGHDNHTAILMGTAEVLAGLKDKIPGTVKFIFQPAEEEPPGGASEMIKAGVLENPTPKAIFGLHVAPYPAGMLAARSGGTMASADPFKIMVKGSATHGGTPWTGVDPIVISSQIIQALQTVVSRQSDLVKTPVVVSIGMIRGGEAPNSIPQSVEMEGTIRTFDPDVRKQVHERIIKMVPSIAQASGATAEVSIPGYGLPVTFNDPRLFSKMEPTLKRVSKNFYMEALKTTTAEDFAWYQSKIPGMFFFLGSLSKGAKPYFNHSPYYTMDEAALIVGVQALANLAVDFINQNQ
ncbi:MAG: amidohydrolase, partial [Thermodesulfobacteriota bacterium]